MQGMAKSCGQGKHPSVIIQSLHEKFEASCMI